MVVSVVLQEGGAALAVGLFSSVGAIGAVFARFSGAALMLALAVRPRVRGLSAAQWTAVGILAVSLTVMNFCFYQAISRAPLGLVVTVEILGPLALSVVTGHRWTAWLWAALSLAGVGAIGSSRWGGDTDSLGFLFAIIAAASWAGYILSAGRAAKLFAPLDALTLATCIGAIALLPAAAMTVDLHGALQTTTIGLGLVVALMCSVIPYSLELTSLRTLPSSTFAVLTSLSPVIAAISGWLVLHQHMSTMDWAGILCVTGASIGAVKYGRTAVADIDALPISLPAESAVASPDHGLSHGSLLEHDDSTPAGRDRRTCAMSPGGR